MDPLIVSLTIDPVQQARFDAERRRLFPAGRSVVGAHVTLFHALPGEHLDTVRDDLAAVADRVPFDVTVSEPMSLGSGVAYRLHAPELSGLHVRLQRAWHGWLTRQDAQGFRPHITVQNKVTAAEARATLAGLSAGFEPTTLRALGLSLWRYVGGPWEPIDRFPFTAD